MNDTFDRCLHTQPADPATPPTFVREDLFWMVLSAADRAHTADRIYDALRELDQLAERLGDAAVHRALAEARLVVGDACSRASQALDHLSTVDGPDPVHGVTSQTQS